jgi:hypothetical protein
VTTLDSDAFSTLGVVVLAAGIGGASGNWWWSAVVVGLALLAGGYAAHVRENETPPVAVEAEPPPAAESPRPQPATAYVPPAERRVIT